MHRAEEVQKTVDKIKRFGKATGIGIVALGATWLLNLFIEEKTWGKWVQIPGYVVIIGITIKLLEGYLPDWLHFKSVAGFGEYAVIWTIILVVLKEFLPTEPWTWLTEKHWLPFLLIQVWIFLKILEGDTLVSIGGRGAGEHHGGAGGLLVYALLLLLVAGLAFWGIRWFNQRMIPEEPPSSRIVVQAPAPPTPEFIFTNQYGLALGKTFKVFTTKVGETNGPFEIAKPGKISWGTFTPDNLVVFRDGVLMSTTQHFTNEGPNLIGKFTFTAKSDAVEYWVATGLSHRVRD